MQIISFLAFLPPETIPVMMVLGAFALMFRLRSIAIILFSLCGLMIFLPVIIEPFLEMLPEWALSIIVIFFWISILGLILSLLIGEGARDHLVGSLAADCIKWFLFFPFRVLGKIFRGTRS